MLQRKNFVKKTKKGNVLKVILGQTLLSKAQQCFILEEKMRLSIILKSLPLHKLIIVAVLRGKMAVKFTHIPGFGWLSYLSQCQQPTV